MLQKFFLGFRSVYSFSASSFFHWAPFSVSFHVIFVVHRCYFSKYEKSFYYDNKNEYKSQQKHLKSVNVKGSLNSKKIYINIHVYLQHTSLYYYSILIRYCRVLCSEHNFNFNSYLHVIKIQILHFCIQKDCNCSHLFAMVFTNQTFFLYMPKNVNMMYTVKIEI